VEWSRHENKWDNETMKRRVVGVEEKRWNNNRQVADIILLGGKREERNIQHYFEQWMICKNHVEIYIKTVKLFLTVLNCNY